MFLLFFCSLSLVIQVPYDRGVNQRGSSKAPEVLNALCTAPDTVKINTNQHIKHVLRDIHYTNLRALKNESLCITMGGDHTIAVGSVFVSQDHCIAKKERLGVLWCDAHADFNTFEESCTKNLHGMPVAILCGHTLPELQIGNHLLDTSQIAYFGIRHQQTKS